MQSQALAQWYSEDRLVHAITNSKGAFFVAEAEARLGSRLLFSLHAPPGSGNALFPAELIQRNRGLSSGA